MSNPSTFVWEFTAPACFPVFFDGFDDPAYLEFSPYTANELKDILRNVVSGFRHKKGDVESVPGDNTHYATLFDNHFLRIVNDDHTPDEQREFCSSQGAFGKVAIVEKTLGGFELVERQRAASGKFDISVPPSHSITLEQDLYSQADNTVTTVSMTHEYGKPTEEQYRKYRNARRGRQLGRKKIWTITEDYDALEVAYNGVIRSISGVTVSGQPCGANRDAWLPHVPLWHKLLVVDGIYGALAEKNG
jgi:stress-induced morphogen